MPALGLSVLPALCAAAEGFTDRWDTPGAGGLAGATAPIARGVEAIEANPAGIALGGALEGSIVWFQSGYDGQEAARVDIAVRDGSIGIGAFAREATGFAPPRFEDWGVAAAALIMRRPHGGHIALGGAVRTRDEEWFADLALQLEPVPMVGIGAVLTTSAEDAWALPTLTAGLAHRWAAGLELIAEREFRRAAPDEARFGAQVELGEPICLRVGSGSHRVTWGVGVRWGGWSVDLAAVADRRSGMAWMAGLQVAAPR